MDVREIKFNYLDNNENELDILYNKKNNRMGKKNMTKGIINLEIEDKSIQMELYRGSALRALFH